MLAQFRVIEDFLRRVVKHHLADIQNDRPIGQMQRRHRVLPNDDGRHAPRLDLFQRSLDFLNDHQRQTVKLAPNGTSFFRLELLCAQEAEAAK